MLGLSAGRALAQSAAAGQNPVLGAAGGGSGRAQRGPAPVEQPGLPAAERNAGGRPIHNEAQRAARWKVVAMPYSRAGLTAAEQQMIAKLADACHLMDEVYLHQSDLGGYGDVPHDAERGHRIACSRSMGADGTLWTATRQFIGEEPLVPGHELYPFGTDAARGLRSMWRRIRRQRAAIYSPWTVVRSAPLDLPAR